jgi:hypothetical protein
MCLTHNNTPCTHYYFYDKGKWCSECLLESIHTIVEDLVHSIAILQVELDVSLDDIRMMQEELDARE